MSKMKLIMENFRRFSEQSGTFRLGLQQKSDFVRNQQDAEFLSSIPSITKQELYKLISLLKGKKDSGDIDATRRFNLIIANFPYNLKDGQVTSIADLNVPPTLPNSK